MQTLHAIIVFSYGAKLIQKVYNCYDFWKKIWIFGKIIVILQRETKYFEKCV